MIDTHFVASTLIALVNWRAAFIVPGVAVIAIGIGFALVVRGGHISKSKEDRKPQPEMGQREMIWTFVVLAIASSCTGLLYNGATVAL